MGDTKLRGPADATTEAFDNGEAAGNLPLVSLPDTEMEGGSDPLAVALVAAEKQTIMREQAMRIQANEARSGHQLQDSVGKKLLFDQAGEWAACVGKLCKLSAEDVQRRCGQALRGGTAGEPVLVVPTRPGFVRMYGPDFWSKFKPMDWCYGDAVFNDPRREVQVTFEQYCENLLRREELEYDVYEGVLLLISKSIHKNTTVKSPPYLRITNGFWTSICYHALVFQHVDLAWDFVCVR